MNTNSIPDIVSWAQSRAGFYIPETKQPIKLAPHQAAILRYIFTVQQDGRLAYDTVVWACPKKSGKTTIGALVAEYFSLFFEAPNEVLIMANDLEQTGRVYKSLRQSVKLNNVLSRRVDIQSQALRFDNGTDVLAIPSDYKSAGGNILRAHCAGDELWGYMSENARRLWEELTPVTNM